MPKSEMWKPHPGPQTEFHRRTEFEVMYGGARGGGKSESLLMEALRYVRFPDYNFILFRRTFPQLQELLDRSKRVFPRAVKGARWKEQEKRWQFPSGAAGRFAHLETEGDKYNYMGHEYQYIGFDELTHFTETQYMFLQGSCRTTNPKIPARIRASTNPGNIGHAWVKARFIDPAPPNTVIRDPQTGLTRIFIPATVYDNPTLTDNDPTYVKRLEALPEKERRMFLYGDWDVFAGQAFPEFSRIDHVVSPFTPERDWMKFICVDWGYSKPFSVLWCARDHMDRVYVYREWYGISIDEFGRPRPDVGVQLDAFTVANGIVQRSQNDEGIAWCVMDRSMWSKMGQGEGSIADDFERALGGIGVGLMQAERSKQARLLGKAQVHGRLAIQPHGKPGLLITENCVHLLRTLPGLPIDEKNLEDIDTKAEDHAYDALRYGLMSVPMTRVLTTADVLGAKTADIEHFRHGLVQKGVMRQSDDRPEVLTYH